MTSLFRLATGPAFDTLPAALQLLHTPKDRMRWQGVAHLERGSLLSRPALWLGGFPSMVGTVPLTLTITPQDETEIWRRDFGGHIVTSTLLPGGPGLVAERLGPVTLFLRPQVVDGALHIPIDHARLGPLPLPLHPRGGGTETATPDGVAFDVDSHLPVLGRIIRYHGTLTAG